MTETGTAVRRGDGQRRTGSVIVVGYSAKPEGRAALRRAIAEAKLRSSRLIVVHTSPEIEVAELPPSWRRRGCPTRWPRRRTISIPPRS